MALSPALSLLRGLRASFRCPSLRFTGRRGLPRLNSCVRRFASSTVIECKFPGAPHAPFTDSLDIVRDTRVIPLYRVMDENGDVVNKSYSEQIPNDKMLKMYRDMVTLSVMDQIFYEAQRQGRISFYMTSIGEEASTVGSAAALDSSDVVFSQYREAGVFMWRGFTLRDFADQCFSNVRDLGKGRQMPVHYGSAALNIQTISSPLTTQLPQAVGAAYGLKLSKQPHIVTVYFGEGAASEGDFHAAMNFAATLECPIIFFCRNNGYAISTSTGDQYRGDGIASHGVGYGMHTVRVDGNDIFAVHHATSSARSLALSHNAPVLIEAMTYRGGHHSTSDDSTKYRTSSEISHWLSDNNPITRMRLFLEKRHLWDSEQEMRLQKTSRKEVLVNLSRAEEEKKPPASELFTDVYDTLPPHLLRQQAELNEHLRKYRDKYDLSTFAPEHDH